MINYQILLKELGFKITTTRIAILDVFINNNKPINADFIFNKLKGNINEVTIYRTLISFEKIGILRKVDLRKDSMYFELNDDHHHHLICIQCGLIEDFRENKDIEKLLNQIVEKSTKFKNIKEHSLELFGFCKICS